MAPSRFALHVLFDSVETSLTKHVILLPFLLVWAAATTAAEPETTASCLNGIDVLQRDGFESLQGRRVGLITNHTGINRDGVSTVRLLQDAENVKLVALFSPEHGFVGQLDQADVGDTRDQLTGLKVVSLYGKTRVPTKESLAGVDTLVFDIQDIGTRFYTYISTMGGAMRAAAENGVRFVVLDRVNPIGGVRVAGPVLDAGSESFVGYHWIAVRHGMTVGELAKMFREELSLEVDLQVIRVEGWRRDMEFDQTGLMWINPSPNMRSLTQAFLYPGVGLLETTNVSVGRGTDTPFEVLGAPWVNGRVLASRLNAQMLPGVRFVPIRFKPDASKYRDENCEGVNIHLTRRDQFDAIRTGITIGVTLRQLYPDDWDTTSLNRLLCDEATMKAILGTQPIDQIESGFEAELQSFRQRRQKYLLYK